MTDIHDWLNANCSGAYAYHSAHTVSGSATAYYFRRIEAAHAFLAAFPALVLADSVS